MITSTGAVRPLDRITRITPNRASVSDPVTVPRWAQIGLFGTWAARQRQLEHGCYP